MSLRRHICRIPFHLKAPKDYVWISEDLLDNALNHFSRGKFFKRNVGLAPGPLEARKRAAKRRIFNLAQAGGGGDIDVNLLGGTGYAPGHNEWQWQSPTSPATDSAKSWLLWSMARSSANECAEPRLLPRWLTDFDSLIAVEDQSKDRKEDISDNSQDHERVKEDPSFLSDLRACRNLDDLHKWATKRNVDLHQYGRLAVRCLIDTGSSIPALLEALEDSALRNPGNLNYFLATRLAQSLSQTDTFAIGQWLRRQISLGILSEYEISTLTCSISDTLAHEGNKQSKCTIIESIFEGLQTSIVFNLQDANHKILRPLLGALCEGPISLNMQALGIRLIKALQASQLEQIRESIVIFITNCIRTKANLHFYGKEDLIALQAVPGAMEALRCLPQKLTNFVILNTSEALIEASENPEPKISRTAMLTLLDHWWSSLARLDSIDFTRMKTSRKKIECILAGKPLEVIVPYLRQLNDFDKVDFILEQWLEKKAYIAISKRVQYVMDRAEQSGDFESPFVTMLRFVRRHTMLSDHQFKRLFRLLQVLKMSRIIVDIILSSNEIHIEVGEIAVLHTIRTHMRTCPEMAQRIFCAYPKLALEDCPDFAETLIANPRIHPGIPFYYYQSQRPGPEAITCREPLVAIGRRAKLLKGMAVAYSEALHLSPRKAFGNVYACYKCHMNERLGPISREMVLAFTYAGIIRPLQRGQWVSSVKLRWVLSLTRAVESAEIADEVNTLVYQWRGVVIRKLRERRRRGLMRASEPWDFQIVNGFMWRWRRWVKRLSRTTAQGSVNLGESLLKR